MALSLGLVVSLVLGHALRHVDGDRSGFDLRRFIGVRLGGLGGCRDRQSGEDHSSDWSCSWSRK